MVRRHTVGCTSYQSISYKNHNTVSIKCALDGVPLKSASAMCSPGTLWACNGAYTHDVTTHDPQTGQSMSDALRTCVRRSLRSGLPWRRTRSTNYCVSVRWVIALFSYSIFWHYHQWQRSYGSDTMYLEVKGFLSSDHCTLDPAIGSVRVDFDFALISRSHVNVAKYNVYFTLGRKVSEWANHWPSGKPHAWLYLFFICLNLGKGAQTN